MNLSLGTIEVYGLPAAVEAADVACKAADVKLIGYETTDGMGMVAVKIEGQVSAVKSAIAAASAAASKVSKVFATSVIPRPSTQLDPVVLTDVTVGLAKPAPAAPAAVAKVTETPAVVAKVEAQPAVVAKATPPAASTSAAAPAATKPAAAKTTAAPTSARRSAPKTQTPKPKK